MAWGADPPRPVAGTNRRSAAVAKQGTWLATLGVVAVLLLSHLAGLTDGLDRWLSDQHWRWAVSHTPNPFDDILVVAIDDRTLQSTDAATGRPYGRLGDWSRERYARLLERLVEARVVGLDLLLIDPGPDAAGDADLATAIRRHGRVVLPLSAWQDVRPWNDREAARVDQLLARITPSPEPGAFVELPPHSIQPPLPSLVDAAAALGMVEAQADPDGLYRRVPLYRRVGDDLLVPHLAVAMAGVALGRPATSLLQRGRLHLGERELPLAEPAYVLQPVARRGGSHRDGRGYPVPTISFVDALESPPERFHNRYVLVGETATGSADLRPSALDPVLRGVELNAEILANLLALTPVRQLGPVLTVLLTILAISVPMMLYRWLPARTAEGGVLAVGLAGLAGLEALFWAGHQLPPWAPLLLAYAASSLVTALQRLAEEARLRQALRHQFSQYVAPEVVEAIVRNPELAAGEGRLEDVCVLYSDLRNFTAYTEAHEPELVVSQMRDYMDAMAASVHEHGGVLDKFIGDAVMALFGPFLAAPEEACPRALACALDMLERLDGLNEEWAALGKPAMTVGIGIHFGPAVVGNIGSVNRMQFTALGDTVNTSERLESLTKELGPRLLVSRAVRDRTADVFGAALRFGDRGEITVRNRRRPVWVYEVERQGGNDAQVASTGAAG